MPRDRHRGDICNVYFFDGHAKAMRRESIDWYRNIYLDTGYTALNGWKPY